MQSKNKKTMTVEERRHVENVKDLPCAVCDAFGPCDAHEIAQGLWYLSIPLCRDCHTNAILGIHGQKRAWLVRKMTELDALNETLRRLL